MSEDAAEMLLNLETKHLIDRIVIKLCYDLAVKDKA
jgi:hypothetical protein